MKLGRWYEHRTPARNNLTCLTTQAKPHNMVCAPLRTMGPAPNLPADAKPRMAEFGRYLCLQGRPTLRYQSLVICGPWSTPRETPDVHMMAKPVAQEHQRHGWGCPHATTPDVRITRRQGRTNGPLPGEWQNFDKEHKTRNHTISYFSLVPPSVRHPCIFSDHWSIPKGAAFDTWSDKSTWTSNRPEDPVVKDRNIPYVLARLRRRRAPMEVNAPKNRPPRAQSREASSRT